MALICQTTDASTNITNVHPPARAARLRYNKGDGLSVPLRLTLTGSVASICHDQSEKLAEFVIEGLIWVLIDIHSMVGKTESPACSWVPVQELSSYQSSLPISWGRTDPLDKLTHWQRIPPPTHPPTSSMHSCGCFSPLHWSPSVLIAGWVVDGTRTVFAETAPIQFCWEQKSHWLEMWWNRSERWLWLPPSLRNCDT